MTKKDYIVIANVFNDYAGLDIHSEDYAYIRRQMAESFANRLEADNPRFDRARFLAACGVTN